MLYNVRWLQSHVSAALHIKILVLQPCLYVLTKLPCRSQRIYIFTNHFIISAILGNTNPRINLHFQLTRKMQKMQIEPVFLKCHILVLIHNAWRHYNSNEGTRARMIRGSIEILSLYSTLTKYSTYFFLVFLLEIVHSIQSSSRQLPSRSAATTTERPS